MEIIEEFYITETRVGPCRPSLPLKSLKDKSIEEVISALEKEGTEFDLENSEKRINYSVGEMD